MIILDCIGMLIFAFLTHLLLWRIKMPSRTTAALLLIFFSTPVVLYGLGFNRYVPTNEMHASARLLLLYVSSSLVYVILYSAIEQQSPTLSMVNFINQQHDRGCDDKALMAFLNSDSEIKKRLSLMRQSGWIRYENQRWFLTNSGKRVAKLFHAGASIFGLKVGG